MRPPLRAIACLTVLTLSGCANYKAVTNFAGETSKMTGAVRQEIRQVRKLCTDVADVQVLLAESREKEADEASRRGIEDAKGLTKSCGLSGDATVVFQEVTVDTLDLYAKTLLAMVDDKQFEVQSSIQGTARKLASLKDNDGKTIISQPKVSAVGSVLALLADVLVNAQREEGIRRLVAAGPDLVANARILRGFFVKEAQEADYQGWLTTTRALSESSSIRISPGKDVALAEPIRAAELRRQVAVTQKSLEARLGSSGKPGEVPAKIVAAIDAWIASVPVFQQEALKPDPRALLTQLDDFRTKTNEARNVIEAGF